MGSLVILGILVLVFINPDKLEKRLKLFKNKPSHLKPEISFYDTDAWRKVRYKAILKYGRKCMACGLEEKSIHVDHIKPRSKFPELQLDINNLQILCKNCNLGKGAWDATDFRK